MIPVESYLTDAVLSPGDIKHFCFSGIYKVYMMDLNNQVAISIDKSDPDVNDPYKHHGQTIESYSTAQLLLDNQRLIDTQRISTQTQRHVWGRPWLSIYMDAND